MSVYKNIIATEDNVMEAAPKKSNRQIIEDGLRTARAQGNRKAFRFWKLSKRHLDKLEEASDE